MNLMLLYKYFKCVQYAATIVNISEASPIWSTIDCTLFFLGCSYTKTLFMRGEIVTPGAFLCQDLGSFDHFIVQGFVFSEHVWTFIHPWWSLRVNAERSCDLKGGGGDREAWLPVVFDTDIAASWFPVHTNQTLPFAHAHFMFWSSVSSEPSSQ